MVVIVRLWFSSLREMGAYRTVPGHWLRTSLLGGRGWLKFLVVVRFLVFCLYRFPVRLMLLVRLLAVLILACRLLMKVLVFRMVTNLMMLRRRLVILVVMVGGLELLVMLIVRSWLLLSGLMLW